MATASRTLSQFSTLMLWIIAIAVTLLVCGPVCDRQSMAQATANIDQATAQLQISCPQVRLGALRSLEQAGSQALPAVPELLRLIVEAPQLNDETRAIEIVLKSIGKPVVAPMIDALDSHNWMVRLVGARTLIAFPDDNRVPHALKGLLNDDYEYVRAAALAGFASKVPSEAVFDTLLETLNDPDEAPHIRGLAAAALGHSRQPNALPFLKAVVTAKQPAIRSGVYAGLSHLSQTELLVAVLEEGTEPDLAAAEHLCYALAMTKDPRAIEALEAFERDLKAGHRRNVNLRNMHILRNCIRAARGEAPMPLWGEQEEMFEQAP